MEIDNKDYINFLNKTYLKNNYNREMYDIIEFKYFKTDNKCRICGGSIYYHGSFFRISKDNILYKAKEKTSSNSKKTINGIEYFICACEFCLKKEFQYINLNKKIFNTVNKYSAFAFNIPKNECTIHVKNNNAVTLVNFIKRYGEEVGTVKFNNYRNKQSIKNSYEYFNKTRGWSKEDFDLYNKSRAVTLLNCIKRHGDEKGTEIYKSYCKKQSYVGVKKEYFIEKYGECEGIQKYNLMLKMKVLRLDNFVRKHGVEQGIVKYESYISNKLNNYSKKIANII